MFGYNIFVFILFLEELGKFKKNESSFVFIYGSDSSDSYF